MARKLPRLQRVLDAPALASVAYGEIASSIYFALGVIALHALGLTPLVLGAVGMLFLIIALSYAEGTAAIRETGGAATFVRIAFNDLAGFLTGWVLFLDYLIVIVLLTLVFSNYFGLGFAFLFTSDALTRGLSLYTSPSWHAIAFALPLAMLANTGLKTVANFAEE